MRAFLASLLWRWHHFCAVGIHGALTCIAHNPIALMRTLEAQTVVSKTSLGLLLIMLNCSRIHVPKELKMAVCSTTMALGPAMMHIIGSDKAAASRGQYRPMNGIMQIIIN